MLPRVLLPLLAVVGVLVVAVLGTSATTPFELRLPPHRLPGRRLAHGDVGDTSNATAAVSAEGPSGVLSRKRRYLTFPRGSSIQLVYCMSVRGYVPFQTIFIFGMTAGLAWQLPTEAEQVYLQRRSVGQHPDREHRVKLYRSVQTFLNQRGLKGEECVQRTVCESTSPRQGKRNFMEEVIKVLFSLPESDAEGSTLWDEAKYNGTPCSKRFPRCASILDVALPPQAQE